MNNKKIDSHVFIQAITFLAFIYSPLTLSDADDTYFSVQIGAFKNLVSEEYLEPARNLAEVYTEKATDLTRIYVGKFSNFQEAKTILTQLEQSGYADAFILRKHDGHQAHDAINHGDAHSVHSHPHPHPLEYEKIESLPEEQRKNVVILDGKLHIKEGDKFIPLNAAQ